jgi:ribosomal protein L19E
MNDKQQQLYNYLKENGLTDLDANTFFSKYSDQGKAKEVWSYLNNKGMTDLDADSFYSSYFKKKSQGTTASTSGTGSSASSDVEIFTGYPGKEKKPYKYKNGKWYEESGVKIYGQKEAQYTQITDPNRIKNLNYQFKKDASLSQQEQIFSNYDEEKKDNLYRINNNQWERKTPGSKFVPIKNEGSINALNKRYGQSVGTKIVSTTTLPPKDFKDITSSFVGQTEEKAIDYLTKNYAKYGFTFQEEGAFAIDRIRVKTQDGSKEEVFEFDEKNPEQAAKLKAFLEENATKAYSKTYYDAVGTLRKLEYADPKTGQKTSWDAKDPKKASVNVGKKIIDQDFQDKFKKLSFEEQKELIQNHIVGVDLPTKYVQEFYKTPAYQDYKKKKSEANKKSEQKLNDLYDQYNYAKETKDPNKIKEAKNRINSYLTDEVIQDNVKNYDMQLNDLQKSAENIQSDLKAYDLEVAKFNQLAKSGSLTQEQYDEQKLLIDNKSEDIETRRQNLKMQRDQIIASQNKLNYVAGKYIAAKEKEGGTAGYLLNKVLSGVSMVVAEPFAYQVGLGKDKYDELSPEEKAYYKSLKYNGKNLTKEQIENLLDNQAILKAKQEAKSSIIKATGAEGTTLEYMKSGDRGWFTQAIGGVLESLPAMALGAGGKAASFVGLAAQAYSGIEEEMLSDPDFQYTSSADRALIAVPYAAAMGVLENVGLNNLVKGDSFAGKVLMGVALKVAKKAGANAALDVLENIAKKEIQSMLAKGLIKITQAGLAEFETGATQSLVLDKGWKDVANWWMSQDLTEEQKKNLTQGEFFETTDGFKETAFKVFDDGLAEMVGGKAMSTVGVISERLIRGNISLYSEDDLKFLENVAIDTEFKKLMVANLKTQMIKGNITKSEANAQLDAVNKIDGIMSSMPDGLSDKDRMNAFNLIVERNNLQEQIDKSDPALVTAQKERVAEINNQLDKISKDAVQKQTTSEVSVQPGAESGREMAQGKSETGSQEVTQEGQQAQEVNKSKFVAAEASRLSQENISTEERQSLVDKLYDDPIAYARENNIPGSPSENFLNSLEQAPIAEIDTTTQKAKQEVDQYIADMGAEARLGATINPIMDKMSNAEFINDNDIDTAIEAIFNEVEQLDKSDQYSPETKAAMSEKLLNIAEKLDNYEFRTKTETVATTKAGAASPTRRTSEAVQKIRAEKYFNGVQAEVNGQQITLSDNNGRVEAAMPNGEVIVIDTPTMEIIEDGFEFDNNGALQAVTVTDRLGNTVKLTGEQALDFAIRDRENKLGVVEQAEFETVYQEIERQYIKENLQDTQKQTNLAKDEKGKPKAGNRLFNEPLKAVAEIANRYFQRVFGSQRPTFEGTTELDVERAKRIAAAYEAMEDNPNDPEVKRAYEAMAKETIEQYQAFLDAGYVVEINNEEPYATSEEMIEDLRNNKRIKIFSTEAGFGDTPITPEQRAANPLLATTEFTDVNGQPMLVNDLFRAVHDFFGHAELGNSFGPKGEENAWNVHARMYSPLARRAMTTETRGQNSFVNFSGVNERVEALREEARKLREEGKLDEAAAIVNQIYDEAKFAEQKIGLLPEEFSMIDGEVQETVNAEVNLITEKNAKLMSVKFKRNPIVRAALNIMKALPGVKIYLHENTDQYYSALSEITGRPIESLKKQKSVGIYVDGQIHLDMLNADLVTLLHEAVHYAFDSLGISKNLFIDLAKGLRPLITDKARLADLDKFINNYNGDETRAEEFMAQLGGILADNREELTVSKLTQFKALINRLMKKIGLGTIFKASATTKEAADLINSIVYGISTGELISEKEVQKTGVLKRQAVTIMQGKESMKKFGLKEGKNVTRKIGEALEARQRAKYGTIAQKDNSPEARKKISNWMVDEVKYFTELMGDKSGKGWYGELYQKSLDAMSKIFPEMKTDQNARDLFTMLVAITSDGQKVMSNFRLAAAAYDYYKKNGVMPNTLPGQRVASFEANLKIINDLLTQYNGDIAAIKKDLMEVKSIEEINKERKKEGLEPLSTKWPVSFKAPFAASVFGPKLGMFYSNLSGNESYPTLDRWWSRTFNRYRGTLIPGLKSGFTKKGEAIGLDRFKELLGNPGMTNEEALLAAKSYRDSYAAKGYKNGSDIEKAANTIYKDAFENLNDAPFTKTERQFMYDTISDAVNKLNKQGYDLSIADVQAILWYFEKNLYKTLGVQAKIEGISYEDAANYTFEKWKESGNKFDYKINEAEEGQSVEDEDIDEPLLSKSGKEIKFQKAPKILGGKPTQVIVKDEYKALLDQIKLEARAQREQKREYKKVLADISATVTSLKSKGNISVKQFDFIMKKLKGLNFDNKQKVSEFIDYVSRALANAEYIDNVQKAKRMSKAIASKLKGKPNPFAIVAKMFTSLDAEYVENIVDHIAVAQMIMDGVKSSSTRGGKLTLKQEPDLQIIADYIDAEQQRQTQRLFKNLQARYENITGKPSTNLPAETMLTELQALKPDVDNSADILDQIDLQLAAYSQLIDEDTPQVIIDAINIDAEEFGIADSIKVLDALDTYFANGVTSGIESLMGAYEGMMNAKKFKFKSSPMSIAMSEKLGRTRLGLFAGFSRILERKFRSVDKANAYQKASGINDIIVGANKADFEATFKQSEYIRKFGKMKGFFSNENIYERGIIADLIRTNPNIDQDAEFNRLINILMDSKNMLLQSSDETKVKMGKLYDKVFKKLGLYNANVTLESVLAKAEQMNIDAVNFAVDMFAEKYEQMSDTAMGVYNIMLNQDINYTPKTYVNIKQGQSKDSDSLSGSDVLGIGQYSNNYFNRNEAGVLMPITRPKDLKSNGKYVDLNFDNNMFRSYRLALTDSYTAKSIRQLNSFYNSRENEEIIGSERDFDIIKSALADYISTIKGKNLIDKNLLQGVDKFLNMISTFGAVRALAGIGQFANQFASGMSNTIVNAGEHMRPSDFSKSAFDFMNKSGQPIANVGENDILISLANLDKSIERATLGKSIAEVGLDKFTKFNAKAFQLMISNPDAVARRIAWMAYYRKYVINNKLGPIDFNAEPNADAAAYAQSMVDRSMDTTDARVRGELYRSQNTYAKIIKSMLFPFSSFGMNQRTRMWGDLTKIVTGDFNLDTARSLASIGAEIAVYNVIRFQMAKLLLYAAMNLLGYDEEEQDELIEKLKKNMLSSSWSKAVVDVLSPLALADNYVLKLSNDLMSLVGIGEPSKTEVDKYIDEENKIREIKNQDPLNAEQEKKKREEYLKENAMQFYISDEANFGTLGIQWQKMTEAYDIYKAMNTGEFTDNFDRTAYLDDEGMKKIKGVAILKTIGVVAPVREVDQIANKSFSLLKKSNRMSEKVKDMSTEIKKKYGKLDPVLEMLAQKKNKMSAIEDEMKFIEKNGGLTADQKIEYAKILEYIPRPSKKMFLAVKNGQTANQILKK